MPRFILKQALIRAMDLLFRRVIMNKVVADLKKYGTVQRALLGFTGQDVSAYIDLQKEKGKEC